MTFREPQCPILLKIIIQHIKETFHKDLEKLYDYNEVKQLFQMTCGYCFDLSKTDLLIKKEVEVSRDAGLLFNDVLTELKKGKPIQYIIGETDFYGLTFKVNENVLIPRQETEELVDLIIKNHQEKELKILDIGTGSGIIPITLKSNLPNATISAIDVSENALIVAKENAQKHKVEVEFIKMDILNQQNWQQLKEFDIIVSNPPYVLQKEKELMHQNVLDFEPHLALFVENENPLLFYKIIVSFAKEKLKEKGYLYFEINEKYGKETADLLNDSGFNQIEIIKDINGKDRIVYGIKE